MKGLDSGIAQGCLWMERFVITYQPGSQPYLLLSANLLEYWFPSILVKGRGVNGKEGQEKAYLLRNKRQMTGF